MTRHIRLVVLAAVFTAILFPTGLSADQGSRGRPSGGQGSRGNPPPSGGQGGQGSRANPRPSQGGPTAVPRPPYQYRPYYGSRYYYPGYGYGYRYPYYGYGYPGFYAGFYSPFFWGGYGFGLGYGYGYGYGYGGYGYGYGPAYGYGYGQYPYPPYYYGPYYDNTGSARLQVAPRNTQVYIDGYFVGVVDNFDGNLQRLNVEAGEHELQLYSRDTRHSDRGCCSCAAGR